MKIDTKTLAVFLVLAVAALASGCSLNAYTNIKTTAEKPPSAPDLTAREKLSFDIKTDRGDARHKKNLVILALSGGGSRAAYWSAANMFALSKVLQSEGIDILKEVDAVTAVSGGTLPAAYYAFSHDPAGAVPPRPGARLWDWKTVKDLMTRPYRTRWILNWFWPSNIARYWFTSFDRTDIMAQTLADNLFDEPVTGMDYRMRDINPERPNLIVNATEATRPGFFERRPALRSACRPDRSGTGPDGRHCASFGEVFPFTREKFDEIGSDISDYEIARAVMGSASFPGAFNYMTLRNFSYPDDTRYVHVFDGGNADNLGLTSASRVIRANAGKYDRFIVILVDSYVEPVGVSAGDSDGRDWFSYGLDANVTQASDSLLKQVRYLRVEDLVSTLRKVQEDSADLPASGAKSGGGKRALFFHIKLQSADFPDDLYRRVNDIKTDFQIENKNVEALDQAVQRVITPGNPCIRRIREFLTSAHVEPRRVDCP